MFPYNSPINTVCEAMIRREPGIASYSRGEMLSIVLLQQPFTLHPPYPPYPIVGDPCYATLTAVTTCNPPFPPSITTTTTTTTTPSHQHRQQHCHHTNTNANSDINNVQKEWFGVGKAPADAQWLELTRRDPEAGTVERMGKGCYNQVLRSLQYIFTFRQ